MISEAAHGYFGDNCDVTLNARGGSRLPLSGVREAENEFTPDICSDMGVVGPEPAANGALIRQSYELTRLRLLTTLTALWPPRSTAWAEAERSSSAVDSRSVPGSPEPIPPLFDPCCRSPG
jgi:hypothetical protein